MGDVEFLKERTLQFLEMSKAAAVRGFYELALFHAEQALQLYTKYLIYKFGDFPKTHFLRDLLDKVLELYGAVCNLDDFLRRPSAVLAYLLNQAEVAGEVLQVPEHAYITSRYLPLEPGVKTTRLRMTHCSTWNRRFQAARGALC